MKHLNYYSGQPELPSAYYDEDYEPYGQDMSVVTALPPAANRGTLRLVAFANHGLGDSAPVGNLVRRSD
jgi:hypothetical protein